MKPYCFTQSLTFCSDSLKVLGLVKLASLKMVEKAGMTFSPVKRQPKPNTTS